MRADAKPSLLNVAECSGLGSWIWDLQEEVLVLPGLATDCLWQRECPPCLGDSGQPAQCGDRQREPQAREPRDEQGKVSKPPRGCA